MQNVLEINRIAWNGVGHNVASPYLDNEQYRNFFETFCDRLPNGGTVLDLGCGPGTPATLEFAKRGFNVTGVDFSEVMIDLARVNVPGARFLCCSMTEITFKNKFDGIYSGHSMLCLDSENFAITAKKIELALLDGGLFFLALNEAASESLNPKDQLFDILGYPMFSRAYSEKEITEFFNFETMRLVKTQREAVITDAYGEERVIMLLFEKK
jgi:SAM-dependent methyltransferase